MLSSKEVKQLRRAIDPEISQRTGQKLKSDNVYLHRLTQECGIDDFGSVDQDLLVRLIVESDWVSMQHPRPEDAAWIADRYLQSGREPDADSLLGSEQVVLDNVTVIGGTGWPLKIDRNVSCVFGGDRIEINSGRRRLADIPYDQVDGLQLHGGVEVSGGGFVGGGFGLEGAALGMLTATALNALTTRSNTYTLIEVTTRGGELFLLYNGAEPGALRIMLSHAFTAIRVTQREAAAPEHPRSGEDAGGNPA